MGILYLSITAIVILDSHSTRWKPVWWPGSSAPSCDGADQTHRLLLHRAVVISDKLSYWPAETSKRTTFMFFCLPCEKQTPKTNCDLFKLCWSNPEHHSTTTWWCQWGTNDTHDNIFSILPSPSVTHSLTHDHLVSHANRHTHTHQLHHVNQSISGQIQTSLFILTASHFLFPLHASTLLKILTILIKKTTHSLRWSQQQHDN